MAWSGPTKKELEAGIFVIPNQIDIKWDWGRRLAYEYTDDEREIITSNVKAGEWIETPDGRKFFVENGQGHAYMAFKFFNFFNLKNDPDGARFETICKILTSGFPLGQIMPCLRFLQKCGLLSADQLQPALELYKAVEATIPGIDGVKKMHRVIGDYAIVDPDDLEEQLKSARKIKDLMEKHNLTDLAQVENMLKTAEETMAKSLTKPESKGNASRGLSLFNWGRK